MGLSADEREELRSTSRSVLVPQLLLRARAGGDRER